LNWATLQPRSLKTRVTMGILVIFALGLGAMAWYASRLLRQDMQVLVGDQQLSTVTVLADQVSGQVSVRLQSLEELAAKAVPVLADAGATQSLLDQDTLTAQLFNRGSFVTRMDGVAIASAPRELRRVGIDYRDRDYMIAALESGRTVVGKPVRGKALGTPVLVMAAPVRDGTGRVIGAVAGVTDLGRSNFLDTITSHRYGETGSFHVVSAQHRLIVTSSDRSRVMQALPPPGANAVIDRLMQGYEGTVVLKNQLGTDVLNSGRRVPVAGWDIVASLPVEEAFAPIGHMQRRMLAAAAALTLLVGGLVWWLLRQQLAPMVAAARALARQAAHPQPSQPLPVARDDEVGTLITGFNRLLLTLDEREASLRLSDQALRSISEGVVITGPDQLVLSMNDAHVAITGYSHEDIRGCNLRLLQGPLTDRNSVQSIRTAIAAGAPFHGELLNYRKDGTTFWNELTISPVIGANGKLTHFVGVTRDVTQRHQAQEQINQLAFFDTLTGLPNRRLLGDRLAQAMAASQRSGLYGAVVFIDLDHFKPLNDQHGHGVGDQLLAQAAERLRASVREADTVARFGGDEFVVVLAALGTDADASAEQARNIAEKIRLAFGQVFVLGAPPAASTSASAIEHRCSASIGLVLFRGHGAHADDLIRQADNAMYAAKSSGRDAIHLHAMAD